MKRYLLLAMMFHFIDPIHSASNFSGPHQSLTLSTPKKKIAVIINPISGGKDKSHLVRTIQNHLDSTQFEVQIFFTKRPHHATELAREAVKQNNDIVLAVGGDGSINEISQALIGSNTSLGIIPTGSGNGLARHLGIPTNPLKAIEIINKGNAKTIDTVRINDRYYLGVAGIGFDAEVGWAFSKFGHRGFLSYLIVTLQKRFSYHSQVYNLTIDGKSLDPEAFLVCFANSSQFGNNAHIAPTANIDDGLLDVVIMKKVPLYASSKVAFQLFNDSLHRSKYVEIIKCKEAHVSTPNLKAHIDGEPIYFPNGIDVKIVPSSLKVIVPSHWNR